MEQALAIAKQSLAAKPLDKSSKNLWLKVANERGEDKAVALAVGEGKINQIRHMDVKLATALCMGLIRELAENNSANEMSAGQVEECVRLIRRKYSHLGAEEIRNAYRLWIAGDTEPKGAEMYRGNFTPLHFGRVMKAYAQYRAKLIAEFRRQESLQSQQDQQQEQKAKAEQFRQQFPKMVQQEKYKIKSWQDVPIHWFDSAIEFGLMQWHEDPDLFLKAATYAEQELKTEIEDQKDVWKKRNLIKQFESKLKSRERTIYEKLFTYKYLIQNEATQLSQTEE